MPPLLPLVKEKEFQRKVLSGRLSTEFFKVTVDVQPFATPIFLKKNHQTRKGEVLRKNPVCSVDSQFPVPMSLAAPKPVLGSPEGGSRTRSVR